MRSQFPIGCIWGATATMAIIVEQFRICYDAHGFSRAASMSLQELRAGTSGIHSECAGIVYYKRCRLCGQVSGVGLCFCSTLLPAPGRAISTPLQRAESSQYLLPLPRPMGVKTLLPGLIGATKKGPDRYWQPQSNIAETTSLPTAPVAP